MLRYKVHLLVELLTGIGSFLLAGLYLLGDHLLEVCIISVKVEIAIVVSHQHSIYNQDINLIMHSRCIIEHLRLLCQLLLHSFKLA